MPCGSFIPKPIRTIGQSVLARQAAATQREAGGSAVHNDQDQGRNTFVGRVSIATSRSAWIRISSTTTRSRHGANPAGVTAILAVAVCPAGGTISLQGLNPAAKVLFALNIRAAAISDFMSFLRVPNGTIN
jgi:hypothetical protein